MACIRNLELINRFLLIPTMFEINIHRRESVYIAITRIAHIAIKRSFWLASGAERIVRLLFVRDTANTFDRVIIIADMTESVDYPVF